MNIVYFPWSIICFIYLFIMSPSFNVFVFFFIICISFYWSTIYYIQIVFSYRVKSLFSHCHIVFIVWLQYNYFYITINVCQKFWGFLILFLQTVLDILFQSDFITHSIISVSESVCVNIPSILRFSLLYLKINPTLLKLLFFL